MIQNIEPKKLYNEYENRQPKEQDVVAVFLKDKILIKKQGGSARLLYRSEADGLLENAFLHGAYQYLFRIEHTAYFLLMPSFDSSRIDMDASYQLCRVSDVRYCMERELCFAIYTAYHLFQWYRDNCFCGRCASVLQPDKRERMLFCEKCGNQVYPKIAPAVIVAVTDGERIVLSKYADREYKRYALIAGFTEIGETAEQTVAREVMEEVGLRVKNIRYYKTQPWGIHSNLLIGYFAELDGDDTIHRDASELSVAQWVDREELAGMDDGFSLTREMMRAFYERR